MRRATAVLLFATSVACLDPLYEDGVSSGYVVCCQTGRVATCACEPQTSCLPAFKPCSGGRCSLGLSCSSGTGGGFATGGGT